MATTISKGDLVLVTGANGYIASHIVKELLEHGYRVRGTVRDASKAEWMKQLFHPKHGEDAFEVVVVKDMAAEGAFDEAMEGCIGVAHVASNLTFDPDPNKVIPEVISGVRNTLSAAARHKTVKRVVFTSSSTAATSPKPNKVFHIDASMWNEESIKDAWAPPPYDEERGWVNYAASKTQAEQECWRFVKEQRPSFVLNAVLPNCNIGRILAKEQPASTAGWYKKIWEGDEQITKMMREKFPPQYFVNVRDTALLHVAALAEEDVKNERVFAFAEPFNWSDTATTFNKLGAPKKFTTIDGDAKDLSTVDTKRAQELLKRYGQSGFTGLEETLKETIA